MGVFLDFKEIKDMKDGFIRCAAITPDIKVADCEHNAEQIIKLARQASENDVCAAVFPELCITGYTCGDLFLHKALLDSAEKALIRIAEKTAKLDMLICVGLPISFGGKLYNCAAAVKGGQILGFVPKINIPNYSAFYDASHFASGRDAY